MVPAVGHAPRQSESLGTGGSGAFNVLCPGGCKETRGESQKARHSVAVSSRVTNGLLARLKTPGLKKGRGPGKLNGVKHIKQRRRNPISSLGKSKREGQSPKGEVRREVMVVARPCVSCAYCVEVEGASSREAQKSVPKLQAISKGAQRSWGLSLYTRSKSGIVRRQVNTVNWGDVAAGDPQEAKKKTAGFGKRCEKGIVGSLSTSSATREK